MAVPPPYLLASLLLVGACSDKTAKTKQAWAPDPVVESELMWADRAFERDTTERGIDGWLDAFTDDGIQLPTGEPIAKGKPAIRAVMARVLNDPANKLRWEPESATVSASGDLGYTLGHATVSRVLPGGAEVRVATVKYLTVWKRQGDSHWKIAVDVGTTDP